MKKHSIRKIQLRNMTKEEENMLLIMHRRFIREVILGSLRILFVLILLSCGIYLVGLWNLWSGLGSDYVFVDLFYSFLLLAWFVYFSVEVVSLFKLHDTVCKFEDEYELK